MLRILHNGIDFSVFFLNALQDGRLEVCNPYLIEGRGVMGRCIG
jgi:hypothetical protein